jgi:tetratricopeptide (TPR) repeat protein
LEDAKTILDILTALSNYSDRVSFRKFKGVTKKLSKIWTKVIKEKKEPRQKLASLAKDFAGAGVGGAIGAAAGGPVGLLLGAAAGAVGGMLTEAATQKSIRVFTSLGLSTEDAIFAMDPSSRLTQALVEDLNSAAQNCRIVLMLDAYERARQLDEWLRFRLIEGSPKLSSEILIVIASRDQLSIEWKKLERNIISLPLKTLSALEAKNLLVKMGISSEERISRIIEDSNCIPWLLQLLGEAELLTDKSKEQGEQRARVSRGLFVERLLDHLTERQSTIIESASILRGFDQDILSATLGSNIEPTDFRTITKLGFMEMRGDQKWAISEEVRTKVEANLKERSPELHGRYHESAMRYYSKKSIFSRDLQNLSAILEVVYHGLRCDPQSGFEICCNIFNLVSWPPNILMCEAVVGEISLAVSRKECPTEWGNFFNGRLLFVKNRWNEAKNVFQTIVQNHNNPIILQSLVLEQLGWIEFHQGNLNVSLEVLRRAHKMYQQLNSTAGIDATLNHLGRISRRLGRRELAKDYHEMVLNRTFRSAEKPSQATVEAHRCMSRLWRDFGKWREAIESLENSLAEARKLGNNYDEALALSRLSELYCFQGRWQDAQVSCESALEVLEGFDNDLALAGAHQNAGRVAMWTQQNDSALTHYLLALWFYRRVSANIGIVLVSIDLARYYMLHGANKRARDYSDLAFSLSHSIGDRVLEALCQNLQADLLRLRGEYGEARTKFEICLNIFEESGDLYHATEATIGLAACVWKLSKKKTRKFLDSAKQRLKREPYLDLSARFSLLRNAIEYERGNHSQAIRGCKTVLGKAAKFSRLFARFLANETNSIWNVGLDKRMSDIKSYYLTSDKIQTVPDLLHQAFKMNNETGEIRFLRLEPLIELLPDQHIILIHHALTEARVCGYIQGRDDTAVSKNAYSELPNVANTILGKLDSKGIDLARIPIHSSPAKRSYEVAFAIADELLKRTSSMPKILIHEDLENIGLGCWEGVSKADLDTDIDRQRLSSGRNFGIRASGYSSDGSLAESPFEVIERAFRVLYQIVQTQQNAIIVGHKMSLIVPGVLFWCPSLMIDSDGIVNWRKLEFPSGGYIIISADGVEINSI